jgi:hypothetical protein
MIENDFDSAGYNTWAYNIVTMLAEREWHKTNFNRVPNDALRLSSIMMDAKYRNQMVHVMSNVKEEPAGLDISGISETAMYEDMVSDFNDPEYVVKAPEKAHLIEWDQNHWNNGPLDPNEVRTMCLLGCVLCIAQVENVSLTIFVSFVGRAYASPKSAIALGSRRPGLNTSEKSTKLVCSDGTMRRPVEKVFRIIATLGRGLAGSICLMKKADFFLRRIPPSVFPNTCGTNLVTMHSQLTRRDAVFRSTCGTNLLSIDVKRRSGTSS